MLNLLNDKQKAQKSTLYLTWGGLFFTIFVYGFVLYLTQANQTDLYEGPIYTHPLFGVLSLAATITLIISFVLPEFLLKQALKEKGPNYKPTPTELYTPSVIQWALCESIAIYGFVIAFLSHRIEAYYYFALPAAILMIIHRPKV